MVSYHGEIAYQILKNQTTGNVEIRCRLEKIDKTGNAQLRKAIFSCSTQRLINDISLLLIALPFPAATFF